MCNYWKQALWIGGIYFVISQAFLLSGSEAVSYIDIFVSLMLLIALLPLKKFGPIKKVEAAITKAPAMSTFLVSVGWSPYFIAMLYLYSVIGMLVVIYGFNYSEAGVRFLFSSIVVLGELRKKIIIAAILVAILLIVKSKVDGKCKNKKHAKLAMSKEDVEEVLYEDKKSEDKKDNAKDNSEKTEDSKKTVVKQPIVKQPVKTAEIKKEVNKVEAKKEVNKAEAQKEAKKEVKAKEVKKGTVKKVTAKKATPKTTAKKPEAKNANIKKATKIVNKVSKGPKNKAEK